MSDAGLESSIVMQSLSPHPVDQVFATVNSTLSFL
jgi:hypothetical protein